MKKKNWKGTPLGRLPGKYNVILHFTTGEDMVYRNIDSTCVRDGFYILKSKRKQFKHPMDKIFRVFEEQNEDFNQSNTNIN